MGFLRQQEERLAMRFITWQYEKMNAPVPAPAELRQRAGQIVDDAHRIARERGRNVLSIMKELVEDLRSK